ncbi:chorismate mutase [Zoogloea sp.]|uniref:chorismate mutase n=1 Tax=Zoogloea sp. TaxID=49181 RepID=UPI003220251B
MSHPEYQSLEEVRSRIDAIDRRLVELIAERGACVTQAARFKRSDAEVAAPDRVAQVLARVDALALASGADPRVIEATWRAMIGAFIEAEREARARLHPPAPQHSD